MIKNKLARILLAVFLAFGLWLYVITVEVPEDEVTYTGIAVSFQNETYLLEEKNMIVVSEEVPTVNLTLKGNRTDLNKLSSSNITAIVDLSQINEPGTQRLGTYYMETGYGIRASKVIYDRMHSAITEYDLSKVDLDSLLKDFDWLHLSGITPALNKNCADFILCAIKTAKEKGLTVSFDGNFRSKLWTWDEARDFCTQCLPYVDVLFGIEPYHLWKDENDHSKGDWKDGIPLQPSYEQQDEIFQRFIARYPNIKCIGRHVRYAHSGSENSLKAFMWYQGHTFESKLFTFNILDRIGGGDAFASGLIYAMMHNFKPMDMVNFAVASSAIKHTIHGDANITDDVKTIKDLMNMSYDVRR